jgi:hypothetical protein
MLLPFVCLPSTLIRSDDYLAAWRATSYLFGGATKVMSHAREATKPIGNATMNGALATERTLTERSALPWKKHS